MADFRYVACPHCGAKSVGKYRPDISGTHRVSCTKCRKFYTVCTGNGRIQVMK